MPQDKTRESVERDSQQIQDDNQTSGESVDSRQSSGDATQPTGIDRDQDTPNEASNKEKAEGSRENTGGERGGGISNRPLDEEVENQDRVPPRGESKDGSHA
jgi:hypothetical protein